jgi:MFS transporter, AAHS family, 4-hydroxybenzoate transporter
VNPSQINPSGPSRVVDLGQILDEGSWGGQQKLFVFLTALAIVFDGVDNQLIGIAVPSLMKDWSLARGAIRAHSRQRHDRHDARRGNRRHHR